MQVFLFRHPGIVSLQITASKLEETSKAHGSSSIASFFDKKESRDTKCLEIEKNKSFTGDKEIESPSEKKMPPSLEFTKVHEISEADGEQGEDFELVEPDDGESTTFHYDRDEIDQSIVKELPDDIRNEIESFLGLPELSTRSKRRRIEKYTISENSTSRTSTTKSIPIARTHNDDVGTPIKSSFQGMNSEKSELIQCSRCSGKFSSLEMPEHLDFHFAMELHENDRVNDSLQKPKPSKKRQKNTIDSFFVSKER